MNVTIFRGELEINVTPTMCGPDPEVGMIYRWVDEYVAFDINGNEVELTDAELEKVAELADEAYYAMMEPSRDDE